MGHFEGRLLIMRKRSEASEQSALIEWWDRQTRANPTKYGDANDLLHFANGGSRDVREAANLRRQGVRRGAPDLILTIPKGKYHGLFVELKAPSGGRVSPEQRAFLKRLNDRGYRAVVARGFDEAKQEIENYLSLGDGA